MVEAMDIVIASIVSNNSISILGLCSSPQKVSIGLLKKWKYLVHSILNEFSLYKLVFVFLT